MAIEQVLISVLLFVVLVFFIHGKFRYDLVALTALIAATFLNLVPFETAFTGFSHPAVITVAAVLIMSRALMNSGIVDFIARWFNKVGTNLTLQLIVLVSAVMVASAFMNNVGALALLMPVAIRMARKNERAPSLYLMPLAFGSLLGGMLTLIGTPANIIISTFRSETAAQTPFNMFAFFPVGSIIALLGMGIIIFLAPKIIPHRKGQVSRDELFEISDYLTQIRIPEKSKVTDKRVQELEKITEGDIVVIGHIRDGKRFSNVSPYRHLKVEDKLIVRASAADLQELIDTSGVTLSETHKLTMERITSEGVEIAEVSITATSDFINRTARNLNLRSRFSVNLLGIARSGGRIRSTPGAIRFKAGDILLLQGPESAIQDVVSQFNLLPLQQRDLRLGKFSRVSVALMIFITAILLAVFNVLPVQIAFMFGAVTMVFAKKISLKELYDSIDWPVIVLLGAMIPISTALETTGTAQLIASQLLNLGGAYSIPMLLLLIMAVTMALSNVINNAAAALLMAPVAIAMATALTVNADPFLMAIAISASSAFLTPIGHQSNTLVLAPGGYQFSDYSRLGIPVSLMILLVSVPLILWIFPL